MFEHFLITRFNLLRAHDCYTPDHETWIGWTKRRFVIFRDFCLPSIVNQTNKNFKWLIYFDTATPSEFDGQINDLKRYDCIDICYAKGNDDFLAKLALDIKQKISPTTEYIITSRLDNDDCFRLDAIDLIQKEFIPEDKFMISLARGYVYDTKIQKLSQYYYLKSPFVSIIEKADSIKTIYYKNHNKWEALQTSVIKELYKRCMKKRKKPKAKFILDNTLWMQLCHGENLGNGFYRGFPVLRSRELNDFGIDRTSRSSRYIDIFKYINPKIWWRQLLAVIFKKAYRV